jgi:ABC-type uncharacterized transport system substrate-binding protein
MRRRELIMLLGGAASAWPLHVGAQPQAMPMIGFLDSGSSARMTANISAFHSGLGEMGYVEGENVAMEFRWAQGRYDQLPALAADLVRRQVAVIAATRGPAPARAAKAATSTIPIVFQTGSDPVADGLVASMNRPGGNVTGASRVSLALNPKRLGLLLEVVPKATSIAVLVNPSSPVGEFNSQELREPVRSLGMRLQVLGASTEHELETAFVAYAQSGANALIVANDPLFIGWQEQIAALAIRHAAPAIFAEREFVAAGGLMSYGASLSDSFRQVGVYVGRILKGAKPADLPIQQPVKFELMVNLKTAKALGLHVPDKVLALADDVIE